jgi:hypothetical protein
MKNKIATKSKPKILLLVVAMNFFTILLVISLLVYVEKVKTIVTENFENQFKDEITRMMDLESQQINTAMENDASWNDFVNFTITKDPAWFKEMYDNPSLYKSDYIGVYGMDNEIINHSNTSKIKENDFIPKEALLTIKKSRKSRFYLKSTDGLIEVFGITITPSHLKNKKPAG